MGLLQPLISGASLAGHNTNPSFGPIINDGFSWPQSEDYRIMSIAPANGFLSNFHMQLDNAPGTGRTRTFVLVVNGNTTSLGCIISGSETTGSDIYNIVSINSNDRIYLKQIPSGFGVPASDSQFYHYSMLWSGSNPIILGANRLGGALVGTNLVYMSPVGYFGGTADAYSNNMEVLIPMNCTVRNLWVNIDSSLSASNLTSLTLTLVNNKADTNLAATVTSLATIGSNLLNSVSLTTGDFIQFKCTARNSTANTMDISWGMEVVPNTSNESFLLRKNSNSIGPVSSNRIMFLSEQGVGGVLVAASDTGVIGQNLNVSPANISIKNMFVKVGSSPTGGNALTISHVVHTGTSLLTVTTAQLTSQNLLVAIIGTVTAGSDLTNNFSLTPGQRFMSMVTGSNSPVLTSSYKESSVIYNVSIEKPMVFHDRFITEIG